MSSSGRPKLKDCEKVTNAREWKTKWFSENGPCNRCGSNEGLELDHINPEEKGFTVNYYNTDNEKIRAELSKCQVLCRSCHVEKTTEDLRNPLIKERMDHKNGIKCVSIKMEEEEHNLIKRAAHAAPKQSMNRFIIESTMKCATAKIKENK